MKLLRKYIPQGKKDSAWLKAEIIRLKAQIAELQEPARCWNDLISGMKQTDNESDDNDY